MAKTGAGKTSILKLLMRESMIIMRVTFFWRAQHQRLYFECLLGSIGYVPQDHFLFFQSIRDNIRFAVPQAPQEAVEAAADLASTMMTSKHCQRIRNNGR